ncbi:MAG: ImmA/IrrE family metallo-endopeptidase [Dehalococcoidia bacterium]|nr:ImmA/IrrE family metallo-endopeptidase [Dehalococcoidia bacterium]
MGKIWRSDRVKALCEKMGISSPERVIVQMASQLVQAGKQNTPPVSLETLATIRGIREIRKVSLTIDGYITPAESGYVVYVNSQQPFTRQRFSIAHEIAHTFFFEAAGVQERHRAAEPPTDSLHIDSEEEALCNKAAAEILMPYGLFKDELRTKRLVARTIVELATVFQVSIRAAARRYCEMTERRFLLLALKRVALPEGTRGLALDWSEKPGHVRASPPKSLLVPESAPLFQTVDKDGFFTGRQSLALGGQSEEYFVDAVDVAYASRTTTIALVVLEPHPEVAIRTWALSDPQFRLVG